MAAALSGDGYPQFLQQYRQQAWEAFESLPMPTTSDEAWRRTDLRGLDAGSFRLPARKTLPDLPAAPAELLHPIAGEAYGGQVLLLPGGVQASLDPAAGCQRGDLHRSGDRRARIPASCWSGSSARWSARMKANSPPWRALWRRPAFCCMFPRGVQVEQPLHSILWGPGVGLAYFSHLLVWVDDGASVTYVHEAASPTEVDGQTLHAGIVEIHVGEGANLRFVELQSWGEHVWNFTHERARVGRDGNLDWIFGAVGSHLTKNFSDLDLVGEGSSGRMSGFYFTDGDQHLDHDTQQNHLAAHTTSDLLFKGALKDHSRSVWQGMIYVAPGAQKTDGYQANRNLILSPEARADSIPGLEILADDVRCTHGATVGKIDPELVFYLRARGIPRRMLSAWWWRVSSIRSCSASPSKACASVSRMRSMRS